MHVYRVSRTRIYGLVRAGGGGGRVYERKTLRSNLAPGEGGVYSRGAYNRASTVLVPTSRNGDPELVPF